ncbi:hypothetical protein [Salinarchaeum laminariae]|uniref:hypothetical protein n=1 Tax=Salinarchaeum laminariae TaxID=869888 RepID=UPI0020BDAE83|nr:hypothetical protein [Salinarchaeum laminariae]
MTEDGSQNEAEEIPSTEDLMEQIKMERQERVENASFDDCERIRSTGKHVRSAGSWQDAVERVSKRMEVSGEQAEWLVGLYIKIFTYPSKRVSSNGLNIGELYFSSEDSLENLLTESDIDSVEEAEEYLRGFVGAHVDEVDVDEVSFNDELPEAPPYPTFDVQFPTSQITGLTETINAITTSYQQQLTNTFDFGSILNSLITDSLEPLAELSREYREIEESDFEFKWLSDVRHSAFIKLYREYQNEGNEAAAELLAAQLRDNEDIEGFKDFFSSFKDYKEREAILNEALDAHAEARYALSIPTLLTQLDGIFIDLALEIGLWRPGHEVNGVKVVGKGEGSPRHISDIDEEFREYYSSQVWPNRIDILHGKRTDYAENEQLSAKLIWLLFQTLHTAENIRSVEDFGDYYILNAVAEGEAQSISAIADRLNYQEDYVNRRCTALEDQNVISVSEAGDVSLLDIGHDYLEGERDLTS